MENHTQFNNSTLTLEEIREKIESCPINFTMGIIGGKWKPIILHRIRIGVNRFGMLQRSIPLISKQMLTSQLRELEMDGLLDRKIYAEVPPRVEYFISEKGQSIFPLLEAIEKWGVEYRKISASTEKLV